MTAISLLHLLRPVCLLSLLNLPWLAACPVAAQTAPAATVAPVTVALDGISTQEQLSQWLHFYYQNPHPDQVVPALLAASKLGLFKGGKPSPPFSGFLAGWLAHNPAQAASLIEASAALPADEQGIVIIGLTYSGLPQTKALLEKLRQRMQADANRLPPLREPLSLLDVPLENGPAVLDALWGYFMAAGDEAPVLKIMTALPWVESRDKAQLLLGGAAKWSLTSNATQHPRVLDICRAQLALQAPDVRKVLAEVIRSAEKELRDGTADKHGTPAPQKAQDQ